MSILFDHDFVGIVAFFQDLCDLLPRHDTGFIAAAKFAETEPVVPAVKSGVFIFDIDIFEVDGDDPVVVFFQNPDHVAAGTGKVTDIQQQIDFRTFFHEVIQFALALYCRTEMVVQYGFQTVSGGGGGVAFGVVDKVIHRHVAAGIPGTQPDIIFAECCRPGESLLRFHAAGGTEIHSHLTESHGIADGFFCITGFQTFQTIETEFFDIFQTVFQIKKTAFIHVHTEICDKVLHFFLLIFAV